MDFKNIGKSFSYVASSVLFVLAVRPPLRALCALAWLTCLSFCPSNIGATITPFASRTFQYTKEQLGQVEDKVRRPAGRRLMADGPPLWTPRARREHAVC